MAHPTPLLDLLAGRGLGIPASLKSARWSPKKKRPPPGSKIRMVFRLVFLSFSPGSTPVRAIFLDPDPGAEVFFSGLPATSSQAWGGALPITGTHLHAHLLHHPAPRPAPYCEPARVPGIRSCQGVPPACQPMASCAHRLSGRIRRTRPCGTC